MDVNFINSLINCTKTILEDVIKVETNNIQTSVQQGASTSEGNGVILRVEGDIDGKIIFDLSKQLFSQIALSMAGETDLWSMAENKEEYNELLKSVVLEFGNLINGRIISTMNSHNYKCKSYPEDSYYENYAILAPRTVTTVVVEGKTKFGNFNIYITNRNEKFRENITILLYNMFEHMSLPIINSYTPKGFFFVRAEDTDSALKILSGKSISFILINIDAITNPINLIQEMVRYKPDVKVLVFSTEDQYTLFYGVSNLNVIGYISNLLPLDAVGKNLEHFFELHGIRKSERRQHVRVKVSLTDNARITFNYKNNNVSGDILDVGIGGVLFALDSNIKIDNFEYGESIDIIKIQIAGRRIQAKGIVRSFRGKQISIEITQIEDKDRDILSQYISERISSESSIEI